MTGRTEVLFEGKHILVLQWEIRNPRPYSNIRQITCQFEKEEDNTRILNSYSNEGLVQISRNGKLYAMIPTRTCF